MSEREYELTCIVCRKFLISGNFVGYVKSKCDKCNILWQFDFDSKGGMTCQEVRP